MNIWASQLGLLKLLRSLEGGTRVQQIIIGYFVAPISLRKPDLKGFDILLIFFLKL
jgi:hypothetical protein